MYSGSNVGVSSKASFALSIAVGYSSIRRQ